MIENIRQSISEQIEFESLDVTGDGGRYEIDIVAEAFRDLNRVKQQRLVYACIKHLISDGSVHAVTIGARPPEQNV